jgi:hypothetical protein
MEAFIMVGELFQQLERRALWRARELGHSISHIDWDQLHREGIGTCTRCGDGFLLYAEPETTGISGIYGTAYEAECPSNTCDHGWQVIWLPEGGARGRDPTALPALRAERAQHLGKKREA